MKPATFAVGACIATLFVATGASALGTRQVDDGEDRFDLVDGAGAEILGVGGLGNRAEEAGKARLGREIPVRPCNQRRAPVEQRHFVHPSPPELR